MQKAENYAEYADDLCWQHIAILCRVAYCTVSRLYCHSKEEIKLLYLVQDAQIICTLPNEKSKFPVRFCPSHVCLLKGTLGWVDET